MHNTKPPVVAGVTSVLLTHFGLQDEVPLGAYRGSDLEDGKALAYTEDLVHNWPSTVKNTSQVHDAVRLYRRTLAAQPDRSVAISSIGLLTNLDGLLSSMPDEHSPLNGIDLVARKVRRVAIMGGSYPSSSRSSSGEHVPAIDEGGFCECNFCAAYNGGLDHRVASAASSRVVARLPASVDVIYSGVEVGLRVVSGAVLSRCTPASNPCRQAIVDYEGGVGKGRFSWDPLTTLMAVRGAAGVACTACGQGECAGANSVNASTGANHWVHGAPTNSSYLLLRDAHAASAAIDELLCESSSSPAKAVADAVRNAR